jgi:kelch-like protein 1/4/5
LNDLLIPIGAVELEEDTVECLMATACLLQLPEIVEACSSFLIRQLHPSNCLGIRFFADSQSCTRLLQVAHNYTAVITRIELTSKMGHQLKIDILFFY